ncbi:dehydrogenase [Lysobacteraceae bacterium NML07-0707]|nr:dehydrogenase [Xanthomonadaceae bacterium NML07-0707]
MKVAGYRQYGLSALLCLAALVLPWRAWAQQPAIIPALDSPVVDTTATLDSQTRAQLEQQAVQLRASKGSQLQILMVPSTAPEDIAQYSQRVFDAWKLGRDGVDDGVLLIVAKDDRRVRIQTGYGLEGAIPDAIASRVIQEYMVPRFRQNDYAGGIVDASAQLVRLIEGETLPEPVAAHARKTDRQAHLLPVLALALFVGNFFAAVFRRLPRLWRASLVGLVSAAAALLFSGTGIAVLLAAILGFLLGLISNRSRRYAGDRSWGGWGSGSGGSWGGGGWSGGGGRSGGGGASGSW